jgi:hypothetical protein
VANGESEGQTAASKANEHAIDFLKQLLTLSGAILALTITFLKDALGAGRAEAVGQWLVPAGWLLLVLVIWTACLAIGHAARVLGRGEVKGYVFLSGKPRGLAMIAQWSFGLGLSCLGVFAITNFSLFFTPSREHGFSAPATVTPVASVTHLGRSSTPPPAPTAPAATFALRAGPTITTVDPPVVGSGIGGPAEAAAERSEVAASKAEVAASNAWIAANRAQAAAEHVDAVVIRGFRK